jgi:hypothetical protein
VHPRRSVPEAPCLGGAHDSPSLADRVGLAYRQSPPHHHLALGQGRIGNLAQLLDDGRRQWPVIGVTPALRPLCPYNVPVQSHQVEAFPWRQQ